jgi:hypothetical protein
LVIADYLGTVTETNENNNVNYVTLNVSGVNDIATIDGSSFTLFPNPAKNTISFTLNTDSKADIQSVEIVSSIGVTVLENRGTECNTKDNTQTIDISQLPSGIYFLKIKTSSKVYVERFIKQ